MWAERGPGAPAARVGPWLAAALAAIVIAAGYLHALHYPFHFDDFDWIRDNLALAPPLDLAAIWDFRPSRFVADFTFALNRIATGGSTASYRAINLLIHWLAALLVGWIAAELTRVARESGRLETQAGGPRAVRTGGAEPQGLERGPRVGAGGGGGPDASRDPRGSASSRARVRERGEWASPPVIGLIAALLFAAHPLATQSVTYLTQRITSLAALLMLASVAAFLRARASGRGAWWAASWAAALAAAHTKEMAVALPFAIAGIEGWLRLLRAPGRAAAWRLLPCFVIVPLVVVAARHPLGPEGRVPEGLSETADIGRAQYLLTQMTVIPRYLALSLWPAGQCIDPVPPLRTGPDPAVLGGVALLAALTAAAVALRARAPLALAGWGWFLVTVAPESSVIPIRDLMMEQRAYLPLAGICWIAAGALAALPARMAQGMAAGALVVALTAATHVRNRVWRDELSLWSDSVAKAPRSARAQNNLGLALEAEGRGDQAERAYRAALTAEPAHVFARVNLGRLYGRSRRTDEALRVLSEADSLSPGHALVLNNLATAWWAKGDTARAAALYLRAFDAGPGSPWAAANLARMRRGLPAP